MRGSDGRSGERFSYVDLERRVRPDHPLLSTEHFSVDGTLIQAWASMKSFRPKQDRSEDDDKGSGGGRNDPADFQGERRSNETHSSTTDPDAMLYRKGGMESRLCFIGRSLMESRSGLIVDARLTRVSGHAERLAALAMIEPLADRPRRHARGGPRIRRRQLRRGSAHAERSPARRTYNLVRLPKLLASACS